MGKTFPRSREKDLDVVALKDETLVYDLRRNRAHCLGAITAAIFERCDGRTSVDKIARDLKKEGRDLDADIVRVGLHRLGRAGLVQGAPSNARRDWIKKAAAIGGLTVLSITAPTLVEAASCTEDGICTTIPLIGCTHLPCCSNPNKICCNPGGRVNCSCTDASACR